MKSRGPIDYLALGIIIFLIAVGIALLASASSDLAKVRLDNTDYYIQHQLIYGLGVGLLGFLFGLFVPYSKYKKIAPILLVASIFILLLTFTPLGFSSGGATRWINVGPVTIQPAEILKLTLVIYLAALFSGERSIRQKDLAKGLVPFLIVCGTIASLLFLQRSTSSVVVIMSAAIAIYFVSGAPKRHVFSIIGLGLIALISLALVTPYRLDRVKTFFNPDTDLSGSGYQIDRALITIGSGGLWGVGFGNSVSKHYLPERIGDSIFAIFAEEFGFVGASILILAFLVLVLRGFILSKKIRDPFGKLILVGFSTIIGVQASMHIASISGLMPLTGVPLPFISYGGTALAVFMTMSGIILNISRRA